MNAIVREALSNKADSADHEVVLDILIVEDDVSVARALQKLLDKSGYSTQVAHSLKEADSILASPCSIVLLDLTLPDGDGVKAVNRIKAAGVNEIIIVSGTDDAERTRQCLQAGVFDFVLKPASANEILRAVRRADAYHHQERTREKEYPARLTPGFGSVQGESDKSVELLREIQGAAAIQPVRALVSGQSGVLKADVAAQIHEASLSKGDAFIINAANETDEHAFARFFTSSDESVADITVARAHTYLRKAAKGTLVIDDLSNLPLVIQRRLALLLDTDYTRSETDSARLEQMGIIGILREPVNKALDAGRLHSPLYYALSRHEIQVPPLVERKEDIALLAHKAIEQLNQVFGCEKGLSTELLEKFSKHYWPGNLVELRNVLLAAYRLTEDGEEIRLGSGLLPNADSELSADIKMFVGKSFKEVEEMLITATLKANNNSKTASAKMLGIGVKTLYNRLKNQR